jgi:predicted RNA polymerase sigma factor
MSEDVAERVRETADAIYRAESRRVFATLVRLLGDFPGAPNKKKPRHAGGVSL